MTEDNTMEDKGFSLDDAIKSFVESYMAPGTWHIGISGFQFDRIGDKVGLSNHARYNITRQNDGAELGNVTVHFTSPQYKWKYKPANKDPKDL